MSIVNVVARFISLYYKLSDNIDYAFSSLRAISLFLSFLSIFYLLYCGKSFSSNTNNSPYLSGGSGGKEPNPKNSCKKRSHDKDDKNKQKNDEEVLNSKSFDKSHYDHWGFWKQSFFNIGVNGVLWCLLIVFIKIFGSGDD